MGSLFFLIGATPSTPGPVEPVTPPPISERAFHVFRKLFFSFSYNSLKCQENIYNLLSALKKEGIPLDDIRIFFIFSRNHDELRPSSFGIHRPTIILYKTRRVPTRPAPPNAFRYHVFATVNGKVLDFDYTDSPCMVPTADYFKTMFAPRDIPSKDRQALFETLMLRSIPAVDYFDRHPQHTSVYIMDLDRKYPAESVGSYLDTLKSTQPNSESGSRNSE